MKRTRSSAGQKGIDTPRLLGYPSRSRFWAIQTQETYHVHTFNGPASFDEEYADFRYGEDDLHPNGGPAEEREGA